MEAAAMAFGKVYCFGPTFRAEKSKTRRHLTEFWMIEPEIAYCDLAGGMEVAEGLVTHVVRRVLSDGRRDLEALERDPLPLEKIADGQPFPRISYDEAIGILRDEGSDLPWGSDLGGDDETLLSRRFDLPVLVHRYPAPGEGLLHEDRPGRRGAWPCASTCWLPRDTVRSSAAASERTT